MDKDNESDSVTEEYRFSYVLSDTTAESGVIYRYYVIGDKVGFTEIISSASNTGDVTVQ
jgi:hypothetical protein